MQEKGRREEEILKYLFDARKKDWKYSDGKILNSMCTSPHPFAKHVYELFSDTNLGDAGLFKGTKGLENEAVGMLGSLLGKPNAAGFVLSGGTEANVMALWIARNMKRGENPELIVPKTAHFSIEKAADMLGFKLVMARCEEHCVDISDVKDKISDNTVAIVGIAGTTEYGTIDDIEALSKIALNEDLYLHVDAAFGGLVIPFLKELGYGTKDFDFSIEGVSSITVDPHKMGLAPIPGGCLLLRERAWLDHIETPSPYLTEKKHYTLTGTRTGASAASVYAALKLLGMEGYRENVRVCMERTLKLYDELKSLGVSMLEPTMNIFVFGHEMQDEISDGLAKKGWGISRTTRGEIRLVIMPHVTDDRIDEFIRDLKEILP